VEWQKDKKADKFLTKERAEAQASRIEVLK